MAQTIESLLLDAAAATAVGDTRLNWSLINDYARYFWLVNEQEIPDALRGDFYSVRAAAADWMGLQDEAIDALQHMELWAKEHDNHEAALVARAHLSYQAMNQTEYSVVRLSSPGAILAEVADRMSQWRPYPESPTLEENPLMTWENVSRRQAASLTAAAATAHTVATNLLAFHPANVGAEGSVLDAKLTPASVDPQQLVEFFAAVVRRFGKNPASKTDELLWYAQEHWSAGRTAEARQTAYLVLELADKPAPLFEAHFMLGHFAMLDILKFAEQTSTTPESLPDTDDLDRQVAEHWSKCAEIAIDMGAPVMALERAELACRTLSSLGQEGSAWSLASRMVEATTGIPVCPALLNIRAMLAQAAFVAGLHQEAWENAHAVAEWSEFTPDIQRTNTCYAIATFAGLKLGLDDEVLTIQERRAALYEQAGEYINASQVLQSVAMSGNIDYQEALQVMQKAWDLLERSNTPRSQSTAAPDEQFLRSLEVHSWNTAEWHLTMANIVVTEEDVIIHARHAAEDFHRAVDPIKEAMSWLTMAGGLIALSRPDEADDAIDRAITAIPDLQQWIADTESDFDPVITELIAHYRYILDFRSSDED